MSEEGKSRKPSGKGDSWDVLIGGMLVVAFIALILPVVIVGFLLNWLLLRFQSKKVSAVLIFLSITM